MIVYACLWYICVFSKLIHIKYLEYYLTKYTVEINYYYYFMIIIISIIIRLLRAPWTARRSNLSILKEISPEYSLGDWYWSWNSDTLATWCKEPTYLTRPWCWERLKAGGEGDDRGWDGWMASSMRWTWVWVGSGSWWWTGRPGVLQSMGSQRVRHNWATVLTDWLFL